MLRVHNTLTNRLERFEPLEPGKVRMYVCGVTVYDRSHIGHARALVTFDVVYRYLEFAGYEVTFVRNFTDVDDKIIARALQSGRPAKAVADENIGWFVEDMAALRCAAPDREPRATEHIAEMVALIQALEQRGLAYESGGDVYYAVERFPGYGKLSGRHLDDMLAGARIDVDERKRHPMDFVLWKASKPGEPAWDSPWGAGRPGWHIECSAMASKYLGQPFDIHGGGSDLIFPHHENEIAQSEGATGTPFARYWLHNGMVTVAHEKMSKSLGNFLTIQQAVKRWGAEPLRHFVLGSHYRGPLDFSDERLVESKRAVDRLYEGLARADGALREHPSEPAADGVEAIVAQFRAAMDDDFNTARALGVVFETLRAMNRYADAAAWGEVATARAALATIAGVLGLGDADPATYVAAQKTSGLDETGISPEEIEALIVERREARQAKDFARADAIRDDLKAKGIVLKDTAEGTTWEVAR